MKTEYRPFFLIVLPCGSYRRSGECVAPLFLLSKAVFGRNGVHGTGFRAINVQNGARDHA